MRSASSEYLVMNPNKLHRHACIELELQVLHMFEVVWELIVPAVMECRVTTQGIWGPRTHHFEPSQGIWGPRTHHLFKTEPKKVLNIPVLFMSIFVR